MTKNLLPLAGLAAVLAFASFPAAAQQTGADFIKLSIEQSRAKNYKEAERLLGECIRIEPRNVECFYRRSLVRQMAIGYGLALEDLNAALQISPNNHVLLTARGSLYQALKRPDEGIADLTKALQIRPTHADAYYKRGNIHREKGEVEKALADYTQAVTFDPKNELSFVFRASILEKKGEKAKAIADYTSAIAINPNKGSNYYYRGKIYFEQGQTGPAETDFKRAVELDPTMATLVNSTKTLAASQKLLADMKANEKTKTPAEAARDAGYRHEFRKEWDQAIVQFTKAIELEPNDHWGYIYRGRAYEGKGDYVNALADLNKGISMIPPAQASGFLFERAGIYYKQGKTALALAEINKVIAAKPAANEYELLLRGRIHAKMGNKTAARTDLEKAVQLNRNLKEAQEELAKL